VTTRESRWTEQDRAEVLALAAYRAGLCACGCGLPSAETTAPEQDGPVYAITQATCTARLALLEAQRGAAEKRGNENAPARVWAISKQKR
jgi:hypothetical protein